MPTTAIFENAILADAVNKAARIAPNKGAAFDKAAGIQFQVNPAQRIAVLRSTDLEVSFEQTIAMVEGKGDTTVWRIPSQILQSLVSTLPMNEGNTVEFIQRSNSKEAIRFKSGRTMAKLFMIDGDTVPDNIFEWHDGPLADAADIAYKVDQVSWACDEKSTILSGVHIDGNRLIGCNTYVLAVTPAVVPITEPVTVPLTSLSVILKSASQCQIRAVGKRFQIALDDSTRSTSGILEGQYPNVDSVMRDDFLDTMKVHRQGFIDALNRMMVLARNEKLPTLSIKIDGTGLVKMLTFDMDIPGVGRMQDSIDVTSEYAEIFEYGVIPRMLLAAVENASGDYIEIDFGHPDPKKSMLKPLQIRDAKGYRCYIMPKVGNK